MKTASLPLLLFSVATASAGVRVEVDPGAPFTEADLVDAVEIRRAEDAPSDEVVIRVAKLGMDQLVVIVGDRSQVVTLDDHDRAASSRVVALVVTAMLDDGRVVAVGPSTAPAAPGEQPVIAEVAAPTRREVRTSYLFGAAYTRDDNGYNIPVLNLGVARPVSPNVRVVGTLGLGRYSGYLDTSSTLIPLRVGIEGRAGGAGVEIGGELTNYREATCNPPSWGMSTGLYGAAKVFLPTSARTRLVGELGGHYIGRVRETSCLAGPNFTEYGGWMGAAIEWTP
jgi:hypothetical protein